MLCVSQFLFTTIFLKPPAYLTALMLSPRAPYLAVAEPCETLSTLQTPGVASSRCGRSLSLVIFAALRVCHLVCAFSLTLHIPLDLLFPRLTLRILFFASLVVDSGACLALVVCLFGLKQALALLIIVHSRLLLFALHYVLPTLV